MNKQEELIERLEKLPLITPKNIAFVAKGIEVLEAENNLSEINKTKVEKLKTLLPKEK